MEIKQGQVIPVAIEDEIKESYLNYAMSVIVSRALPDVRDGLKPVHRRIIYEMNDMGLTPDRAFKKCGTIVGNVLGKYHPHGDQSVYDALVRLAQSFSMRYPVIRPQGNFGSVDGDPPAAYRYTESKMEHLALEMVRDIRKDTVDFGPNYDDSRTEPLVLPAAFPYLLVNGASGIAVGMATNIPPHNLREVFSAIAAYIENPDISINELMTFVKGPDFPTGAQIFGLSGIRKAYRTGKGKVTIRARCTLETGKGGRDIIIVNELPYMVNKANLCVRIAALVSDGKITGISDLRDESDRDGMRVVIELKRGAVPKVILNQLFTHTALQQNFNVNNLALVNGIPKLLTLKDSIKYYVEHRHEVVTRRTKYDLKKAEDRAHILEGLKIALDNIDEVIRIIRASRNVDTARTELMEAFDLSERQAQAILDMRLQRLTSLETQKVIDELKEVKALIAHLKDLLSSHEKLLALVKDELQEVVDKHGDDRKTEIVPDEVEQIDVEDLIKRENMVVIISKRGFIKRIPVRAYRRQGRGGKGSSSALLKNDDFLEHLFISSTHNYILFVTNIGQAYWLKVHEIPEGTRTSRGTQVKALLSISADEEISAVVSLSEFSEDRYLFLATRRGIAKKVTTASFSNARTRGIIAIKLDNNDSLVGAILTSGNDEIVFISKSGYALRCHEETIRATGRSSRGVSGHRLNKQDELAAILPVCEGNQMMLISEYGYAKRIEYNNFSSHNRGTKGQIAYKISDRTGELNGALTVQEDDELVCITSQGNAIRLTVGEVPVMGKAAKGVRIVNIEKPDYLVDFARVVKEEQESESASPDGENGEDAVDAIDSTEENAVYDEVSGSIDGDGDSNGE